MHYSLKQVHGNCKEAGGLIVLAFFDGQFGPGWEKDVDR